ncbi:hypothetical protein D3C80_1451120 [compost metagenome]
MTSFRLPRRSNPAARSPINSESEEKAVFWHWSKYLRKADTNSWTIILLLHSYRLQFRSHMPKHRVCPNTLTVGNCACKSVMHDGIVSEQNEMQKHMEVPFLRPDKHYPYSNPESRSEYLNFHREKLLLPLFYWLR